MSLTTHFMEARSFLSLAWPAMISRLGILSLQIVDTIMVGRYATEHLAYLGVGQVLMVSALLISVGLLLGTMILASNYYGQGAHKKCGRVLWQSIPFALLISVPGVLLCWQGEAIFLLFGQPPDLAMQSGRISMIVGASLPVACLYTTTSFFLEGINRTRPGMVVILIANILNVLLNSVLIYGLWGFPEMGAEGSAWATLIIRVIQVILIIGYVWTMHDHRHFGIRVPRFSWRAAKQQRAIGYASGISLGMENIGFNILFLFAGMMSTLAVAAYAITINIFAACFMLGLGIAAATAIRVGNAYGANNHARANYLTWLGLLIQLVFMIISCIFIFIFAHPLVMSYSHADEVVQLATVMVQYVTLAIIMNAAQALITQALRARQDVWMTALLQFFSFGLILIPAGYMAVSITGRLAFGLVDALVLGTTASVVTTLARFIYIGYIRPARQQDRPMVDEPIAGEPIADEAIAEQVDSR